MWEYEKPDNLVSWWEESEKKFSTNVLFWVKNAGNTLDSITYSEIGQQIKNTRQGLALKGIKKGDAVGIISGNRPEWCVLSYATYGRGASFVPMYEKELVQTWKYIIKDSGIKSLFVSTKEIYEKVKNFKKDINTLKHIFIIDDDGRDSLSQLQKDGAEAPSDIIHPDAQDTAILIYTSGTTGDPKGVLLSHGNCTYCSRGGYEIFPELDENHVGISILPWAHSYAFSGELNNWIQFGGSLGFMEDVTTLADDLKRVRPTYLISVPRVFNKIFDGINAKMDKEGGLKKLLFNAARSAGRRRRELKEKGRSSILNSLSFSILDKVVFSKIRDGLGGRVTGALTASAVMNRDVGEFFFDIGIPTYDCYGLSETAPAVTMNCSAAHRLGSVGKVLRGQKVVIDSSVVEDGATDGEIVVYGPNVMKGYHNKKKETAQVMTKDGGFRTGDRGRFDEDGFLYITGRIKEQYKLENGKYVFPASIEEDVKLLPLVANAMIYGEGKPYNICIIFPDFNVLIDKAKENQWPTDPEELINNADVQELISRQVDEHLKKNYGGYEIPKKYHFTTEDFTVENGMLTQTLKLKRRVVVKNYHNIIERLYK